jgi:hypothetical protein
MPVQKRPTAVTVIAIINFVLGGLALLNLLCGGLALALLAWMAGNMPVPAGQPNPFKEMEGLFKSIPGFIPTVIAKTSLDLVLAIVLIVAGVGLLRMRRWARTACLIYAAVTILATLGYTVYNFAVVLPAMEKWQADFQAKMQPKGPPGAPAPAAPTGPPPAFQAFTNKVGAVAGALFGMAYAIVLLIVLNLAHVRAAFARAGAAPTETDREAARAWQHDEPAGFMDEQRGRLPSDDDRFQGPEERPF